MSARNVLRRFYRSRMQEKSLFMFHVPASLSIGGVSIYKTAEWPDFAMVYGRVSVVETRVILLRM